ncbi:unnamed protein product [Symbiodinium natans]|uniref:Uncharacterized protein n=1 Tax=Symbiodinium natans TaxID=878477 RepID=A0A812PMZ0_9DINO|nr:unnamed protein product [Symbiodinium natans]
MLVCRRRAPWAPSASAPDVPEEALEGVAGPPFGGRDLVVAVIIDIAMWVALYWRDYANLWNITVAHYYSFILITDLAALRVPAARRGWWNPFRAIVAMSYIVHEASLALKLIEPLDYMLFVREGLCLVRLIHAVYCVVRFGPGLRQLAAFPAYFRYHCEHISAVPLLSVAYSCVGFFCPYIFIQMHYNYGKEVLDGPLTALQASYTFTVVIKSLVLNLMAASPLEAGLSHLISCILFSAQYPLIFDMYWECLLKMGHVLAEVFFGLCAVAYLFFDIRLKPLESSEVKGLDA